MSHPTRRLTKAEAELELARLKDANTERWFDFGKHITTLTLIGLIFWMLISGLSAWVSAKPDAIKALAEVVKAFNLNTAVGYILATIATGGAVVERSRRKRLEKRVSREPVLQNQTEEEVA
ncbi:hypothetical protein [Craterilacuibacter sinensis]|uniref:Holin n=1 Tax=Craterilacuibacter sinensis TaxID=2686017 RepID=A0A845BIZ1_9NEIS|nr:hypothetical protein [Craterilacuibacter sinensis]MXR36717.1 hypothetical protein [Craterilacuibacter sinensis]